jgi:hypothetical protein
MVKSQNLEDRPPRWHHTMLRSLASLRHDSVKCKSCTYLDALVIKKGPGLHAPTPTCDWLLPGGLRGLRGQLL